MSFFKKIFGDGESAAVASGNAAGVKFGRYTDCNKTKAQVEYWKKAIDQFKNKSYVDSFESFLLYLRDENVENVNVSRNGSAVEFEIIQGSKVIKGKGDTDKFVAEANIAVMEQHSLPVMRKLMSLNYALRYSKFALTENKLCMKFSSHAIDASPNKLYDALKELARKADQQDDLLVSEFSSLKEIDTDRIIPLDAELLEVRYQYLMKLIDDTKAEIAKYDAGPMSGGIAFLLLNLSYTIDYLILPQGQLTDSLEKIQQMFFAQNDLSTQERNSQIIEEFDKIKAWPKEDILDGLYDVKCTFAIARPESHKYVMDFFFKEREKVGWYRDNKYPKIVEAVYSYMITYAFFNMGMVYPMSDLLNICLNMLNQDYYKSFGQSTELVSADGSVHKSAVVNQINSIVKAARADYPNMAINTNALNYTGVSSFIDSLIVEMDRLNLQRSY